MVRILLAMSIIYLLFQTILRMILAFREAAGYPVQTKESEMQKRLLARSAAVAVFSSLMIPAGAQDAAGEQYHHRRHGD